VASVVGDFYAIAQTDDCLIIQSSADQSRTVTIYFRDDGDIDVEFTVQGVKRGVFVPVLRENMEMLYQFEHDYQFDSTKLERAFGLTPTLYREGIAATLKG
jgi:hypothetical protein